MNMNITRQKAQHGGKFPEMRCTHFSLDTVSHLCLSHHLFAFVCIVNELLLIPQTRSYLHMIFSEGTLPFVCSLLQIKHSGSVCISALQLQNLLCIRLEELWRYFNKPF